MSEEELNQGNCRNLCWSVWSPLFPAHSHLLAQLQLLQASGFLFKFQSSGRLAQVMCICAQSFSCVQLFSTSMNCSLPGSSVHGIFPAGILESAEFHHFFLPFMNSSLQFSPPTPLPTSPSTHRINKRTRKFTQNANC